MKVGIIGCGGIAKVHADNLKKMNNVYLAAFADTKLDRAEQFVLDYAKNAKAYASYEKMIQEEKLDAVHICTPHYLHTPMAVYALENNVNVFMEKPPAITREQFDELKASAAKSSKQLGLCFQNRYNHTTKCVDNILAANRLGRIIGARAFVTWNRQREYYTMSDWRGRLSMEGGGALINQGIHTLDLLVKWLGKPKSYDASMSNYHLKNIIEVEDKLDAFIEFDGACALFYVSNAFTDDAPVIIDLRCEHGCIRIENTKVIVSYNENITETYEYAGYTGIGKTYWGNGHTACINDFYKCIEEGRAVNNSLESAEDTFMLMLKLYEAARNKN